MNGIGERLIASFLPLGRAPEIVIQVDFGLT